MQLKFTDCPTLLSTPPTPIKYLVDQLIPRSVMLLLHGDPRTRKSYSALELAIACSTGLPAFGLNRFRVAEPSRVLYLSQEDPVHVVRERIRNILIDKQIDPPENLSFGIHQGIDLDSITSRNNLFSMIKDQCFRMVFIDPMRRFTAMADKGPSEVTPITTFLRKMCVELDTTPGVVHHNTKPPTSNFGSTNRKESYNASGGDWFASCECPISFHSNGNEWSHVIPQDYKLSVSPDPFDVQVIEDEDGGVHIRGRDVVNDTKRNEVLSFLLEHPQSSENAIAKECSVRRADISKILKSCHEEGILMVEEGPRHGRLWSIAHGVVAV